MDRTLIRGAVFSLTAVILLVHGSCKKSDPAAAAARSPGMLHGVQLPAGANAEMKRIHKELQQADQVVEVADNAMFTQPGGEHDIYFSGATSPEDNVTITLNGNVYASQVNGQWLREDAGLRDLFGKNVSVEIRSRGRLLRHHTMYVPKQQLALISRTDSLPVYVNRTGTWLRWIPDASEQSGYVILDLTLRDQQGKLLGGTVRKLVPNTGSYLLDEHLADPAARSFFLDLITGNWVAAAIGKKTLTFGVALHNHHLYEIQD